VAAAALVAEIARQPSPPVVVNLGVEIAVIRTGGITQNIAAARRTATVEPLTGLAVRHEATLLPTVSLVLDNSLADRAAICPAIEQVMEV